MRADRRLVSSADLPPVQENRWEDTLQMMSSSYPVEGLPAVDERLVAPESGYEVIDGRIVEVPGAGEAHGTRHAKVAAMIGAAVRDEFDVAVDMLTRTSKLNDFAPDVSVFPRARDPRTGGRQIEQLAFEIVSTQALSDAGDKASKLTARGVRRMFAIDIRHARVFEWAAEAAMWQLLAEAGVIADDCLAAPIAVEALVKAAKIDDAVARTLLLKGNPVLMEEMKTRELDALRRAALAISRARGLTLTEAQRDRIATCEDASQLETWLSRLATASAPDTVFD